ncbi:MAG: cytochrome c maturation protein CcmE [Desulfovibrionales bacterium]
METKGQKWILPLALALVVAGAAFLVFTGLKEESVYFVEVSEALAMENDELGHARLFGMVDKEFVLHSSSLGVSFALKDKQDPSKAIPVVYTGSVPDTFKAGVEVIVEGSMKEDSFLASTLMTKCPSKYEKQQGS